MSRPHPSFREVIKALGYKYGQRNTLYMPSRYQRLLFLAEAIHSLGDDLRKSNAIPQKQTLISLASVLSRTITFSNSFIDLDIVGAMSKKYPIEGCAYCGKKPCKCEYSNRDKITEEEINPLQLNWSIQKWCQHLNRTYGAINKEKGVDFAFKRLNAELFEVLSAEFKYSHTASSRSDDFRDELSKEFADIFAWIFAISNIEGLNVGGIIKAWAFKKCHDCGKNPCACGPFVF
jgi:NTP pyrophosphatase (non-canonical NTP hydrolase)